MRLLLYDLDNDFLRSIVAKLYNPEILYISEVNDMEGENRDLIIDEYCINYDCETVEISVPDVISVDDDLLEFTLDIFDNNGIEATEANVFAFIVLHEAGHFVYDMLVGCNEETPPEGSDLKAHHSYPGEVYADNFAVNYLLNDPNTVALLDEAIEFYTDNKAFMIEYTEAAYLSNTPLDPEVDAAIDLLSALLSTYNPEAE